MRSAFQDQLDAVEADIVRMADAVAEQFDHGVNALTKGDVDLAVKVIADDDIVDDFYIDLRERTLTIMATQAPVASDLRLLAGFLHLILHLERMGDICTTLGKMTRRMQDLSSAPTILNGIHEMGREAAAVLRHAVRAFANRDLAAALALQTEDDVVDRLNRSLFLDAIKHAKQDDASLEWAARIGIISRLIERFADHAVDIGEETAYLITGEFREFTDASHPVPDLPGPDSPHQN